jgi:structural maintenance of chromosome 2
VVAKLIWVKEAAATIAIDVIAGGKLFNVVVDTEKNAQKLLTHGQIRHRITIIPLNKISKTICNDEIIHKVTKNFHGKAKLALDFIGYDKSLFNAMCHIFGNAFICDDAATARNVAFNKETLTRCVTLNGDDFNPLGLVSGGYRQKRRSVLNILCEIQKVQFDLKAHSTKINGIKEQIFSLYRLNKEKTKLYQKLGLSIHSLELIKTLFIDSELYKKNEHILKFEKSLIDNRLSHDITFLKLLKLRFMIKAIEKEINIRKHNNSLKEEKRIERKLVRKKQIAGKAKTNLSIDNETISTLQAGREKIYLVGLRLENDLLNTREILCCSEVNIKYNERQSCRILNAIHLEEENLINYNSYFRLCNLKISELSKFWKLQQDKLTMLEIKKREYIKREKEIQVEQEFAMKKLNSILSTNFLNIEECHSICYSYKIFGSLTQIKEKVSKDLLKSEKEKMKLEKRVNKKALSLCIQMEEEYNALELKKSIVLSERKKIENVIKDLDYVKEKLVKKAWNKVNKDFGSIFATLLPGASARLTEPKGQTFMNGLEVNVAFENTWKQSLNELSGGQRSLLSLSLVLALLLFKPAPIYILDEVDAALDLNHTQNLSKMIKKHFPQSQFIIVSLKEEMFKNANVLYTTKFLNGLSTVIRTSQMEKNV